MINELITQVNDALWGYVLIGALVACGIWFTLRTKGVQFRMIGEMFRLLTDSATSGIEGLADQNTNHKHISSFQAFAVSVATRVGTGNLAGVATAIGSKTIHLSQQGIQRILTLIVTTHSRVLGTSSAYSVNLINKNNAGSL